MIEVEIEDVAWAEALPDAAALAERAGAAALVAVGDAPTGEIVILLGDDSAVRALNARFRGKDQATNVLAFPSAALLGPAPDRPLGDLALAFGVCVAEARDQGKPLAHHLQHLVIHGVLHLLGHDHEIDSEAEAMEALERLILQGLGVPDPYRSEVGRTAGAGHV